MKKLAERWLAYARKDLVVARQLTDQPEVYDIATFHCQQAVEKCLKGFIVLADQEVPRIHDLPRLYQLVIQPFELEWEMEILELINEFYIETRYPLHEDQSPLTISIEQLNQIIQLAERAVSELGRHIGSAETSGDDGAKSDS